MKTVTTAVLPVKSHNKKNPNAFRLTIYFDNPTGANDFKTTETRKDMNEYLDVFHYCNAKIETINKAYWNNKLIIADGRFLNGWERN